MGVYLPMQLLLLMTLGDPVQQLVDYLSLQGTDFLSDYVSGVLPWLEESLAREVCRNN